MIWMLLACTKGDVDDTSASDDTSVQCGSMQGFVYGEVTFDGVPTTDGRVMAELVSGGDPEAEDPAEATVGSDSTYEHSLWEGTYTLYAINSEGCASEDHTMEVAACEEFEVDFDIVDCETADKPNLYLYPSEDTPTRVSVDLDPRQVVVASAPELQDGAWEGTARPDGTWEQGGEVWPFLFYEVSLSPAQQASLVPEAGWCRPDLMGIAADLDALGFTQREVDDFVDAWREDLPAAEQYAVRPVTQVDAYAGLTIEPALPLSRVWLVIEPSPECDLAAPELAPLDRSGPHAVEWGVVLRGF